MYEKFREASSLAAIARAVAAEQKQNEEDESKSKGGEKQEVRSFTDFTPAILPILSMTMSMTMSMTIHRELII